VSMTPAQPSATTQATMQRDCQSLTLLMQGGEGRAAQAAASRLAILLSCSPAVLRSGLHCNA
jgi:hypothetical protein